VLYKKALLYLFVQFIVKMVERTMCLGRWDFQCDEQSKKFIEGYDGKTA
jgi:hypothetical protein